MDSTTKLIKQMIKTITCFIILLLTFCSNKEIKNKFDSTYSFSNDTINQKLEVKFLSENRILFNLTIQNFQQRLIYSILDTASILYNNPDQYELNIDMDFDIESQSPYFVTRFFYKKRCDYLTINIENGSRDRASIGGTDDCNLFFSKYCPLRSVEILRKATMGALK